MLLSVPVFSNAPCPASYSGIMVRLEWDGCDDWGNNCSAGGYRLYSSTSSGNYTYGSGYSVWSGTETRADLSSGFSCGAINYFVATVYNDCDLESDP